MVNFVGNSFFQWIRQITEWEKALQLIKYEITHAPTNVDKIPKFSFSILVDKKKTFNIVGFLFV